MTSCLLDNERIFRWPLAQTESQGPPLVSGFFLANDGTPGAVTQKGL